MEHLRIGPDDPWPEAVSDGLTLPCSYCGEHTMMDYRVTDREWERVFPPNTSYLIRLGVVCLQCFVLHGGRLSEMESVQITLPGQTLVLEPNRLVEYGERVGGA